MTELNREPLGCKNADSAKATLDQDEERAYARREMLIWSQIYHKACHDGVACPSIEAELTKAKAEYRKITLRMNAALTT